MSSPSAPILSNAPRSFDGALEFYWYPPASSGDSAISSYTIGCTSPAVVGPFDYPVGTRKALVSGLSNGVLYNFTINATNDNSNVGPAAAFRPFEPGTSAPTAVTVATASAVGSSDMLVSWSGATSNDATIYWYTLQTVSSDPADPVIKRTADGLTQSNLFITGLNPSSTYYTLVRAVNCPGYSPALSTNTVSWGAAAYVWTEQTGSGSRGWYSIASSSDGTKLAANIYSGVGGYIYTSTDSGVTWAEQTTSGSRVWASIASSSDGTKLAAPEEGGYIYTSTDSGVTWTEQTGSGSRVWYYIASSSDGTKLAAGVQGGYIYTSTDSGATWTEQTGSGSRGWVSITCSSDGTKLAACDNGGYIYTSADSGVTWTQQTSAGSRSWGNITSSSNGTKLAVVEQGGYIYTALLT